MEDEYIKAWVTEYALSQGILFVDGKVRHSISGAMLTYGLGMSAHGLDWHRTKESALARAEQMRDERIESLKRSLAKIEALSFSAPDA